MGWGLWGPPLRTPLLGGGPLVGLPLPPCLPTPPHLVPTFQLEGGAGVSGDCHPGSQSLGWVVGSWGALGYPKAQDPPARGLLAQGQHGPKAGDCCGVCRAPGYPSPSRLGTPCVLGAHGAPGPQVPKAWGVLWGLGGGLWSISSPQLEDSLHGGAFMGHQDAQDPQLGDVWRVLGSPRSFGETVGCLGWGLPGAARPRCAGW